MSNRNYSYSRLTSFIQCPRKHYYNYIEKIYTKPSGNTLPGSMFHKCCELFLTGKAEEIQDVYNEFDIYCSDGTIQQEPGLLKYLFELYLKFYEEQFKEEHNMLTEFEFSEVLNPESVEEEQDIFKGIIDEVFYSKGLYIIRDRKTSLSKLKYNYDNVKFNQQLLLYVPFAEEKLGVRIDAIEIDEVRFAKLQPVPLLKTGKPTKDKGKLDLVTYEAYYNKLCEMCLEEEAEYKGILDWLSKRGHPLFNRVRVQLLDERIVNSNAQDILELYHAIKTNSDCKYRCRNILCDYCPYKELCSLDMATPDEDIRQATIDKISID